MTFNADWFSSFDNGVTGLNVLLQGSASKIAT